MPYFPYPELRDAAFSKTLQSKLEMSPVASREACRGSPAETEGDGRARFDLHPVQQFVTSFMSPMTPYRSLLLFHGTGVGKTCTAVNIAESFAASGKQPLLVVPQSVAGQFRKTMYDVGKVPVSEDGSLDLRASARAQCTGSKYVVDDEASGRRGLTRGALWLSLQQKLGRRFRIMGHDVFGNQVEALRQRVYSEFVDVTESAKERELTSVIRSYYDGRVIVVDEVHDMVPKGFMKNRGGYDGLLEVVRRCNDVRLVLMTATPMFDKASEIVPLLNLILTNEKEEVLRVDDVIEGAGSTSEALTKRGRDILSSAAFGRVSFATGDDPRSFPASLSAKEAGVPGAGSFEPPALDFFGREIPAGESWASVPDDFEGETDDPGRIVISELSPAQEAVMLRAARGGASGGGAGVSAGGSDEEDSAAEEEGVAGAGAAGATGATAAAVKRSPALSDSVLRQVCNMVFDPDLGDYTGEAQFRSAFQVSLSRSNGMQVSPRKGRGNPLSEALIVAHAPKFARIVDSVVAASGRGHLCFVFSSYVWSGVLPLAVALELRGLAPAKGPPLLSANKAAGGAAGKYVIISKHPSLDASWGVTDKVSAANTPGSGITVVLGTEMASQGLDFAGMREIHIAEPWYNSSRLHQVVGRGVRRCSHSRLPPSERNVTVCYHAARFSAAGVEALGGRDRETVDVKSLRFSRLKRRTVSAVERVLRDASLDCDLYHRYASSGDGGEGVDSGGFLRARELVASNGKKVSPKKDMRASGKVSTCAMPWRFPSEGAADRSTFHPYAWSHRTDMTAWDIADLLMRNRAMTYDEIMAGLGAEQTDLSASLALDVLLDPLRGGKYLHPEKLVYVTGTYALVPEAMHESKFTLREARERSLFGSGRPDLGLVAPVAY